MINEQGFNDKKSSQVDFVKSCEDFRKKLIASKGRAVKKKTADGTVITIDLKPKYFAFTPKDGGVDLIKNTDKELTVLSYTQQDWDDELCVVESTQDLYHPAYKFLCPVMHNAPRNPVWLNSEHGQLSRRYINKIQVVKFKDGSFDYHFNTITAKIDRHNKFTLSQTRNFSLAFPPAPNPNPILKVNGEVATHATDLLDLIKVLTDQFLYTQGYSLNKDYMVVHRLLNDHLSSWLSDTRLRFHEKTLKSDMAAILTKLRNSPLFYDLPFNEIQLLNLFNPNKFAWRDHTHASVKMRDAIHAKLRVSDTKSAVDACFYGCRYPESIKKLMLKSGLLTFSEGTYKAIAEAVDSMGVDRTRIFITDVNDQSQPDYYILRYPHLIDAFAKGINVSFIKDIQKMNGKKGSKKTLTSKERYVRDTMGMYAYLSTKIESIDLPARNLKVVHDHLSVLYNIYRKAENGAEMTAIKTVDTSNQIIPFEHNGYLIRSPTTAYELLSIGEAMRHCVGSYMSGYYYRRFEIAVLVNDAGEYLACIEIRRNNVVQAKLRINQPAWTNEEYLATINAFMDRDGLKSATQDLGVDQPDYEWESTARTYDDPERLAIVKSIKAAANKQAAKAASEVMSEK